MTFKIGNSVNETHGMSRSPTYVCWNNMIQRCTNENRQDYQYYGGIGITVCSEWYKFKNFLEDMGIKPKDLTLDRIDVDKGYYKENCRWATRHEQRLNQAPRTHCINDHERIPENLRSDGACKLCSNYQRQIRRLNGKTN